MSTEQKFLEEHEDKPFSSFVVDLAVAAIGVLLSIGFLIAGYPEFLLVSVFLAVGFGSLAALKWHVQQRLRSRSGQGADQNCD